MSSAIQNLPIELLFGLIAIDNLSAIRLSATCRSLRRAYIRYTLDGLHCNPLWNTICSTGPATVLFRFTLYTGLALVPIKLLDKINELLDDHGAVIIASLNAPVSETACLTENSVVTALRQLEIPCVERRICALMRNLFLQGDGFLMPGIFCASRRQKISCKL